MISITSTFLGRPTGLLFYYLNTYTNYSARTVAVTRISELNAITTPSGDDLFIINDGSVTTNKITYANILAKVTDDIESSPLVFTNSVELSSALILSGVISVTGDITFTGGIGGIDLGKLDDVDMSVPPTAGQNLVWDNVAFQWKPGTTVIPSGVVVDSINGQIGTVVLNADDIDDTATSHKFATAGQLGLADTALQPADNISELTNDANYTAVGENLSVFVNDVNFITSAEAPVTSVNTLTGAVVLDPDDLDDTSTDHKFATSVQLGLAETAVQPTDSVNALNDVDTVTTAPEEDAVLVWDGTNWIPGTGSTTEWDLSNNGTTAYNFAGLGFAGTEDNPDIYVVRGQRYRFAGSTGTHPFAIQSTAGTTGTLYNDGVTDNGTGTGTVVWEVRMDAPDDLFYQCRNHSAMVGNIRVLNTAAAVAGAAEASNFTFDASLIPDTNATYDLGSAEFKIRHLYLSDNSIQFESGTLSVASNNLSWGGEPVLPTTLANLLSVLGVQSHPDNGTALGAGLLIGDVYYNTTSSRLTSVTA